jgi:hypothetical protein
MTSPIPSVPLASVRRRGHAPRTAAGLIASPPVSNRSGTSLHTHRRQRQPSALLALVAVVTTGCSSSPHPSSASTEPISATLSGTVAGTAVPTTGLEGHVTAGPTCPVERIDQPCPPRPVTAARVNAVDSGGRTAASTLTDPTGRYALSLPRGRFTLRISTGGLFPRCPDTPITVDANVVTVVDVNCDTGIR